MTDQFGGITITSPAQATAAVDKLAAAGKALLMVSSDLRELMSVCDRIAVMSAGRLAGVFERGQWTQQSLLEAAFSGYLGANAEQGAGRTSSNASAAATH